MSNLPITPLSPEEQQRLMGQTYLLMAKQVKSYHKHHHMGENSSVPVELAQELMESMAYTMELAGGLAIRDAEQALRLGQELLEDKVKKSKSMLELVSATAPTWQTDCRWDALSYLRHYLNTYDYLHLAHRGPDDLFYPILIAPPEGICGIDSCLFYLNILWIENQIMAGIPEDALESFWDRLPSATANQCEHLLINGIGKALLGSSLDGLVFEPEEHIGLIVTLMHAPEKKLKDGAKRLCQWINLEQEDACRYVEAVIPQLTMWIESGRLHENVQTIFL